MPEDEDRAVRGCRGGEGRKRREIESTQRQQGVCVCVCVAVGGRQKAVVGEERSLGTLASECCW